jgi:hypothetical protein
LLSPLGLATNASAQITPGADAYTNIAAPSTNYGAAGLLSVDAGSATTYIQFDLSSIPAGASVSQATLKLYVNAVSTPGSFNVQYVSGAWTENTITSILAPALGAAIASNLSLAGADTNQYVLINITPAVVAWLNGSEANNGLALVADGVINVSFDSKENATTSHPAELDIVFSGAQGAAGPVGPAGARGRQGATGQSGAIGPAGPAGAAGPQGPIGLTGAQGPAGANGTNGINGTGFNFTQAWSPATNYNPYDVVTYNGSTYDATVAIPSGGNPPGASSSWALIAQAGVAGAAGAPGSQGPQGMQGAAGPQGPIGLTGAAGPAGANGTNGSNGTGFNFTQAWSAATNYNPYDLVTYNGSTYDATVAVASGGNPPNTNSSWAPMAQAGAAGAAGSQGPQGLQGIQGASGPQGPIGLTGAQGLAGANGTNGSNGTGFNFTQAWSVAANYNAYDVVTYNGSTYDATVAIPSGANPPGTNSSWAVMAQAGDAGAAGSQGAQGLQGMPGATGPQGPIGLTGAQGAAGANGTNGADGTNGANGTGFNFTQAWSAATNYNPYDVVTYNNSTYDATVAIAAGGNPPGTNSSWTPMAQAGAAGAAGAQGPQGSQGLQGTTGAQGPQGTQGTQGATGPQGPQGPAGLNANSLMTFSSFYPGNLSGTWVGTNWNLDSSITVLRIAATAKTPTGSTCPAAVFRLSNGTQGQDLVLTPGQYWSDTGSIELPFAAGTTVSASLRTGSSCAVFPGADTNLLVEYRIQQTGDTNSCGVGASCNGYCTSTSSDPNNCGTCGTTCAGGYACVGGSCTLEKTCAQIGAACGSATNVCGAVLSCGTCPTGSYCSTSGTCLSTSTCTPTTCAAQGATCGTVSNGCGGTLNCGTCSGGQVCDAVSFVCETCNTTTCGKQGAQCGTISNGCGGTLNCGTCSAGDICHNGACTAALNDSNLCQANNATCGTVGDACGAIVECGVCGSGYTCSGRACVPE